MTFGGTFPNHRLDGSATTATTLKISDEQERQSIVANSLPLGALGYLVQHGAIAWVLLGLSFSESQGSLALNQQGSHTYPMFCSMSWTKPHVMISEAFWRALVVRLCMRISSVAQNAKQYRTLLNYILVWVVLVTILG
jgi:hypothetical protein